ncbi:MAG: hypothetical protein IJX87_05110 [Clostridia bacterium]|nr:hypothetical protein [Clostridia bacterium]
MEEKIQTEEGINFLELVKLLLSKVKILILVVLIAATCGAVFAVWRYHDVKYYGTRVEFYVNPEKPNDGTNTSNAQYGVYGAYGRHVMDNMVKLLASESFAEQLMLEENGLPTAYENYWESPAEECGLENKIAYAEELMTTAATENEFYEEKKAILDKAEKELSEVMKVLNLEWQTTASTVISFSEAAYQKFLDEVVKDDINNVKYANLFASYAEMQVKEAAVEEAQEIADAAKNKADIAQKEADEAEEDVFESWRKTEKYMTMLSRFKKAVSYSYLQEGEDANDVNDLARSFIYVNISILNDEGFAEDVLERVRRVVPDYVEENMTVPSGYSGTNCLRITRTDQIEWTNPSLKIQQATKYGVLLAVLAFVVTCIAIVVIDRSDKRLRDYEPVMRELNIPVLGVVPMIDMENQGKDSDTKKKTAEVK